MAFAFFLLAAALIWQFAVKPSFASLDKAKLAHERASQTHARLDRVEEMLLHGESIRATRAAAPADGATLRDEIIALAVSEGLSQVTVEAAEGGRVRARMSGAPAQAIFAWAEQVDARLGLTVSAASLQQNAAGSMDAELVFRSESAR